MRDMDIGEVVRRSGVPASALRYYEENGLIASRGRRGLRRQYPASVLDRHMLATKADELDRTIRRMTAMRDGLRHAAVCPAQSHSECPTFRRLLEAALAGRLGESEAKARRRVEK